MVERVSPLLQDMNGGFCRLLCAETKFSKTHTYRYSHVANISLGQQSNSVLIQGHVSVTKTLLVLV